MKKLSIQTETAELSLTLHDLDLLRNGLNEAMLAVKGDADFETRLGATRDEAGALIDALIEIMQDILREPDAIRSTTRRATG